MPRTPLLPVALLVALAAALPAAPASSTPADPAAGDGGQPPLAGLVRNDPDRPLGRRVIPASEAPAALARSAAWDGYLARLGSEAEVWFDADTGEPAMVKGAPEPLVPGRGNRLAPADLEPLLGEVPAAVDAAAVEAAATAWLERHRELLTVPLEELAPRGAAAAGPLWVVTWEHRPGGVPVAGSRLTLIVGHGNLVLWGSEGIAPLDAAAARSPALTAAAAEARAAALAGWDPLRDRWLERPRLVYHLVRRGTGLVPGRSGRGHRLVWEATFARDGDPGSWLVRVDAASGEVVALGDANRYAETRGGVQPDTWSDAEQKRPLPLVGLSSGGFSSIEGRFDPPGPPVLARLLGQRVRLTDQCGDDDIPELESDPGGDVDFGIGPPNPDGMANCATNGIGDIHNTHAARTTYYHSTRFKEAMAGWLPGNAWLDGPHRARTNNLGFVSPCTSHWNPSQGETYFGVADDHPTLGPCYNAGEIADMIVHETGHGLDQNDAQGAGDAGTSEAYADVAALLRDRDTCIGDRLWLDRPCTTPVSECAACDGERDLDPARHLPRFELWTPGPPTPEGFVVWCRSSEFPVGVCGDREIHCESQPASGAVWDLAAHRVAPVRGEATAWYAVERDWVLAMQAATAMYNCDPAAGYASDGCAATSWFQAFLAADDDNGDLTDGTPHAAEIFAAFDAHGIACGEASDPGHQSASGCPALTAPALTATPGAGTVELAWSAVPGAAGYALLKNHGDCDQSSLHLATVGAATTALTDADVASDRAYGYRVLALGGGGDPEDEACYSPLSNCAVTALTACADAVGEPPQLATPAPNQVEVGWDDGGACGGFSVYRRRGGCGPSGEFERIASGLAGSPLTDGGLLGGVPYGYRIAPTDPSGSFETGLSPCAEATPTGGCAAAPLHDSASLSAASAGTLTCGVTLTWSPALPVCPGQSAVYNVYRSTDPDFEPSPATRIATGVAGTSFTDGTAERETTYHYIVRAAAAGVEETGDIVRSVMPRGPETTIFADDMESGTGAWVVDPAQGTATWALDTSIRYSPVTAWAIQDTPFGVHDQRLELDVALPIASAVAELRFQHRYDVGPGQGGVLEYSTDGGATWWDILEGDGGAVPVGPFRFLEGPYNGTLFNQTGQPLPNHPAWTRFFPGAMERTRVDLADFSGQTVRLRWRFVTQELGSAIGWWVDDVEVVEIAPCDLIFEDGFESGDASAWSAQVP